MLGLAPSLTLYLSDDYDAACLPANLNGDVVKLYPRDSCPPELPHPGSTAA